MLLVVQETLLNNCLDWVLVLILYITQVIHYQWRLQQLVLILQEGCYIFSKVAKEHATYCIGGNFQGMKFSQTLWLNTFLVKQTFHTSSINIECGANNCSVLYYEVYECLELSCEQMNMKIQF